MVKLWTSKKRLSSAVIFACPMNNFISSSKLVNSSELFILPPHERDLFHNFCIKNFPIFVLYILCVRLKCSRIFLVAQSRKEVSNPSKERIWKKEDGESER